MKEILDFNDLCLELEPDAGSNHSSLGSLDDNTNMLTDGEELLRRLSGELGLPEFLDDIPMMEEDMGTSGLTFFDHLAVEDSMAAVDNTIQYSQPFVNLTSEVDDAEMASAMGIKQEVFSPVQSNKVAFPPSPSNSDSSDNDSNRVTPPESPMGHISLTSHSVKSPAIINMPNIKVPIPKIQKPKPVQKPPLIITTQQFAKLTENGVIQLATPSSAATQSPSSTSAPLVIKTEPGVISVPTSVNVDPDIKALKRQQRMIKNRESACLSRKKKKEYLTNIEEQLDAVNKENRALRRENEALKARIRDLERGHGQFKVGSAKKVTALMAVLCFVSLNVSSLRSMYYDSPGKVDLSANFDGGQAYDGNKENNNDIHLMAGGRSLLWVKESSSKTSTNKTETRPHCLSSFNQSESIRLDTELRGWFRVDPTIANKNAVNWTRPSWRRPKKRIPTRSYQTGLRGFANERTSNSIYEMHISRSPNTDSSAETSQITLFESETPRSAYASFFEAINRRDDTFYVVSFSGDHLLLPASLRNESFRPRMSLLLPAMTSLNGLPKNHMAMMQIDCEVINTKLLTIDRETLPPNVSDAMKGAMDNSSLQKNDSGSEPHFDANTSGVQKVSNVTKKPFDDYNKQFPVKLGDNHMAFSGNEPTYDGPNEFNVLKRRKRPLLHFSKRNNNP